MGFIKETYSNNRAGLIVAFNGNTPTANYTPTDSIQEAINYFDLYISNGNLYSRSESEQIYTKLGIDNRQEVEILRTSLDSITSSFTDETAIEYPILFKEWRAGVAYIVGDRIRYGQGLFKVLQAHTSQAGWEPTVAHSLFAILLNPDPSVVPEWIQPDSTNGYALNDRVLHSGVIWISTADNNVWEPGSVGAPWKVEGQEEEEETTIPEWTQPDSTNPYSIGDRVMYNGQIYESTINNNTWSPEAYPAGWTLIEE